MTALLLSSCSILFEEAATSADTDASAEAGVDAAADVSKVDCGPFSAHAVSDFTTIKTDPNWAKFTPNALIFDPDLGFQVATLSTDESSAIRPEDFHSGAIAIDMRVGDIPDDGEAHFTLKLQAQVGTVGTGSQDAAIRVYATTLAAFGPGDGSLDMIERLSTGGDYRVRVLRDTNGDIRMQHSALGITWTELGVVYNSSAAYAPRFAVSHTAAFVKPQPQPMRLRAIGEGCQ